PFGVKIAGRRLPILMRRRSLVPYLHSHRGNIDRRVVDDLDARARPIRHRPIGIELSTLSIEAEELGVECHPRDVASTYQVPTTTEERSDGHVDRRRIVVPRNSNVDVVEGFRGPGSHEEPQPADRTPALQIQYAHRPPASYRHRFGKSPIS